jgi:hypothetical protein
MKMKYFAAAGASVLALCVAAPAFAQSGYIGGNYGEFRIKSVSDTDTIHAIDGAYSTPLGGGGFNVQAEGVYADLDQPGDSDMAIGAVSLYTDWNDWEYGGTVAIGDIVGLDLFEGSAFGEVNGEAFQATIRGFFGNFDAGVVDVDYRGLTIDGNFFLTDNASIRIGGTYADFEAFDPVWTGTVGGEWKMANSPIGITTSYSFNEDYSALWLGVRGTFGANSLIERENNGPTGTFLFDGLLSRLPAL